MITTLIFDTKLRLKIISMLSICLHLESLAENTVLSYLYYTEKRAICIHALKKLVWFLQTSNKISHFAMHCHYFFHNLYILPAINLAYSLDFSTQQNQWSSFRLDHPFALHYIHKVCFSTPHFSCAQLSRITSTKCHVFMSVGIYTNFLTFELL